MDKLPISRYYYIYYGEKSMYKVKNPQMGQVNNIKNGNKNYLKSIK